MSWSDNSTTEAGFQIDLSMDGGATWSAGMYLVGTNGQRYTGGIVTNYPDAGEYSYSTKFTVSNGVDLSHLPLNGSCTVDNPGLEVYLNGVATNNAMPNVLVPVESGGFTITSGFCLGQNTLKFRVSGSPVPGT